MRITIDDDELLLLEVLLWFAVAVAPIAWMTLLGA